MDKIPLIGAGIALFVLGMVFDSVNWASLFQSHHCWYINDGPVTVSIYLQYILSVFMVATAYKYYKEKKIFAMIVFIILALYYVYSPTVMMSNPCN